ncbi:Uma2 family endonuclease [Gloeobacter kilaueensis]|uniref:Electron transport complex protein RnfC n=1 Tax=Gloeobacter kilaueensis (strain ATCC BAA-2537 / CCAP 1431/1 / ULC 316 / JS1) TaxID=1183438 RepID=U5QLQ9_GLOK1|nr:Uma2 family endonuclease [Gloeobacter kilaueensis]AGY58625.1 electron transport complex protein RnfC [Gloeobacter kilaueensis JS1]
MTILPSALFLPDHLQLPESDGTFVKNFQEHPQSLLLTDSIAPHLQRLHPDGQYCIGQDSGIYWRLPTPPEPLYRGAESPDWFFVPGVPPNLKGQFRRSYVLWQEIVSPLIVLEFVSGSGEEERDRTPFRGKFWVYEQAIRVPFYSIYEVEKASVEVYHLVEGQYALLAPNERSHFPIGPMAVELGLWQGTYQNVELPWLRWWDLEGNLLLTGDERAAQKEALLVQERERAEREQARAEQERERAERERERAEQLAARLRELGIDPS